MPDNASVTPANDSAVIHEISLCVYQAILENQEALIWKTHKFLQILLMPNSFELPILGNLMEQIRALIHQRAEYNNSASIVNSQPAQPSVTPTSGASSEPSKGIAILL